jgi:hypothetical protein
MFTQILRLILRIGVHGFGLLAIVCNIHFYLTFYPSPTNVRALSQLLLHIFLLSPFQIAGSQAFKLQ